VNVLLSRDVRAPGVTKGDDSRMTHTIDLHAGAAARDSVNRADATALSQTRSSRGSRGGGIHGHRHRRFGRVNAS